MRKEDILEKALTDATDLPVKEFEYAGTKPEYIVYNDEARHGADHGDNTELVETAWFQVHIFTSKAMNYRERRETAKRALIDAGFLVTDVKTRYEKETRTIHIIIYCNM